MTPKLTDHAVSRLPLEAGRAELLEEIMSTVSTERQSAEPAAPTRSRRGWLVPLAAAAVVAGIALSSLWWRGGSDAERGPAGPSVATQQQAAGHGRYAVLDAPGWTVTSTEESDGYGGVYYENGGQSLEITRYTAGSYQDYVTDREHIVEPPAAGEPIQVLGMDAQMWAYDATDHTAIRQVQDGWWMEFRGQGMDATVYQRLLGQLRLVDRAGFETSLPDRFVTGSEREATVSAMLQGIEAASGAGFPAGQDATPRSDEQDPYQLGAAVAGAYTCAWIVELEQAEGAGDTARADEAARVLGTSHDWPVLNDMNATGDYPEEVWQLADQASAGQVPEGYREGLGCG